MITPYLRRGTAAGLLAGLFGLVVGEPLLDIAVALDGSAHAHDGSGVI